LLPVLGEKQLHLMVTTFSLMTMLLYSEQKGKFGERISAID